jgi:methylglutaconyl-CoA hydratase
VTGSGYETIELEESGGIAHLWLNRPDIRNAMSDLVIAELTAALSHVAKESDIRVLVLGGRGSAFCAGADLTWMKRSAGFSQDENRADAGRLAAMLKALHSLSKPTIARVHGPAFAGGMGLAAACDIVVADQNAVFCLSEVRIGLVPATISPYIVQALGIHAARRYMLTAERLTAAHGQRIGFVHELCEPGTIDAAVDSLAQALRSGGPAALMQTKRLLDDVATRFIDPELMDMSAALIASVRASSEGREGIGAFLEKRKPTWVSP